MNDWNIYKLKEITTKIGSGSTPKGGKEAYYTSGVALVRSLNVYDFSFELNNLAYLNDVQARKLRGVTIQKNDILLNITGASVGRCTIIPEYLLPARVNQHVSIIRCDNTMVDPNFLLYCINSASYKDTLMSIADSGATREALTKEDIEKFQVLLPPLTVQKRIASVLSNYDELAKLNEQRIKLLEDAASQLYKEWFVRKRFPEYKKAKFVKGVPQGWMGIYFRDFIKLNRGFDLPDEKIVEGPYPVVASTSIKAYHNQFKVEAPCVSTGRSGSLGTVQYINQRSWPLNTSLYVKDFKGNSPRYVYYFLQGLNLENFNAGAGVPSLNQNHLHGLKLILPPKELQLKFDSVVVPIFEQIENLQQQNIQLRQIRDRLLPRLISGKLEVKASATAAKVIEMQHKQPVSMVAEDDTGYVKTKKPNLFFQRRVLAAYIIDRLKNEPTFGHVKLMKLMYLCEHLAEIETASNYHRDAAGPYDNKMIRSIDSQLKTAQWFECKLTDKKYTYTPLAKKDEYKAWFTKYYSDKEAGIESLLQIFGKEKTELAEMVATLYEAHRDLKERKQIPSDNAVINEVLNNWHDSKKRIEESRWRERLADMKERGWIN